MGMGFVGGRRLRIGMWLGEWAVFLQRGFGGVGNGREVGFCAGSGMIGC